MNCENSWKWTCSRLLTVAMAAITFVLADDASAATYTFTDVSPGGGFPASEGTGISSGQQVGLGYNVDISLGHALLWSGTAGSVVDLNPAGFTSTYAYSISGGQQVGEG